MLFSKRRKLAKEYREWLITGPQKLHKTEGCDLKTNLRIKDCAENVIAFLDVKGFLKE